MENKTEGELDRSLTILLTPQDIKRCTEVWNRKDIQRARSAGSIIAVVIFASFCAAFLLCLIAGILRLDLLPEISGMFGFLSVENMFTIVLAVAAAVFGFACLKRAKKIKATPDTMYTAEMARRKDGFLPRKLTFEKDGIRTRGRYADFVIGYDELKECHEFADGLFFLYNVGQYMWIPARFFSRDFAQHVSGAMQYVFGKKYFLHEALQAPEQPECPQEEMPLEPQGEPLMQLDIEQTKGRIAQHAVNRLFGAKTILFMLLEIAAVVLLIKPLISSLSFLFSPEKKAPLAAAALLFAVIPAALFIAMCILNLAVRFRLISGSVASWAKWNNGVRCNIYENIILRDGAAGRAIVGWDKVDGATMIGGDMFIVSAANGTMIIPSETVHQNEEQLFAVVREQLEMHHHHDHECEHENCSHDDE